MTYHASPVLASGRLKVSALPRLLCITFVALLILCASGCVGKAGRKVVTGNRTRTFVSQNFFSLDYPGDWVTRDLADGANLFYADELIFVRIKILEPPDPHGINEFIAQRIKADADIQGGQATLLRSGNKGANPFSDYLITKPNGQRMEEILLYNDELKLLYVIFGSSQKDDFDEFAKLFVTMFDSFQFRVTARLPSLQEGVFQPDLATMQGIWTAFLEGLRTEDFDLLQKSCARVNGSKIINDENVRKVKANYFPYHSPLYTFVSHIEVRDKVANVDIALRALPPEGFLKHETREFIKEDNQWRLLRFERLE
jgi:hypothetical protein